MVGSINPLASSLNIQSVASTASSNAPDSSAVSDSSATATEQVKPRASRGANAAPAPDSSDDSSDTVKQQKRGSPYEKKYSPSAH